MGSTAAAAAAAAPAAREIGMWVEVPGGEREERTNGRGRVRFSTSGLVRFGRLGFSGLATAAADTAGRHSAVGPLFMSLSTCTVPLNEITGLALSRPSLSVTSRL
jgi:hypothetical protein